jgi:hypothetical protein
MKILLITLLTITSVVFAADCDQIYKGRYFWGHEVNSFQPCNSTNSYWVSTSSTIQSLLIDFVKKSQETPYKPVYLVFRGHYLNEDKNGFASDYDGLIRISEIKELSNAVPGECK